jgi:hypothetical protein
LLFRRKHVQIRRAFLCVKQHFMLKSQLADAREAAISSSEQHAQPKHHETQKTKKQRDVYCAMAHADERRLNCRMGVEACA